MGIRFVCESCSHKLHVKTFLAGKLGICPHCDARVRIPETLESSSQTQVAAALTAANDRPREVAGPTTGEVKSVPVVADARDVSVVEPSSLNQQVAEPPTLPVTQGPPSVEEIDPINEAPAANWYVRPPSGGQFGPASGEVLRSWISEGRVTADSLVWREGWEDWVAAESRFSSLGGPVWEALQAEDGTQRTSGGRPEKRTRRQQSRSSASAIFVTLLLITAVLLGILVVVLLKS